MPAWAASDTDALESLGLFVIVRRIISWMLAVFHFPQRSA